MSVTIEYIKYKETQYRYRYILSRPLSRPVSYFKEGGEIKY